MKNLKHIHSTTFTQCCLLMEFAQGSWGDGREHVLKTIHNVYSLVGFLLKWMTTHYSRDLINYLGNNICLT